MTLQIIKAENIEFYVDEDYISCNDLNNGSPKFTKGEIIINIIRSFSKDSYNILVPFVVAIAKNERGSTFKIKNYSKMPPSGYGTEYGGIYMGINKNKKPYYEFQIDIPGYEDERATLSVSDGIKLFHAFFNTYKKYIENKKPEQKKDRSFQFFIKQLKKLNKLYNEMVKKGEIKKEE